ncbi:MAG: ComEC/Rec2 family competence protein [candidate division WOR-3 bacterium]
MRYAGLRTLIALALGIILAERFDLPIFYLIVGIVTGFIFVRLTKGYSLYLVIFFVATLNHNAQKPILLERLYYKPLTVIGTIIDEPVTREHQPRYILNLKSIVIGEKDYSIVGKLYCRCQKDKVNLQYGDLISYQGMIEPLNFPRNPNLIDLNKYFYRQGIFGTISLTKNSVKVIAGNKGNPVIQYLIFPLRRYFFKVINHYLINPERALYAGILLGEKQDLPKELKTAFSNTGLTHILAVSGLNVGILVGICLLLFSIIGLHRWRFWCLIGLGVIVFLYVGVTGFEPSAVRAGLMAFFASLGFYLERRTEPLQGVFIAGILILLFSPQALFDISFQLSFGATISLILFAPKIYRILSRITSLTFIRRNLLAPLAVVLAAQLGVGPLLVYYFFKLSVITVFANLLVVPLVGLATPLAFTVAFFHLLVPFLAKVFAEVLWLSLTAIIFITNQLGNLSFASVDLPKPSILLIIFYYILILMLFHLNRPLIRKGFFLVIFLSLNLWAWGSLFSPPQIKIYCLDLYSDATLIELPNRKNLLINTGGRNNDILLNFLKSKGIKVIDQLIMTHSEVYQGIKSLKNEFRINKIILPKGLSILIEAIPQDKNLAWDNKPITLNRDEVLKFNNCGLTLELTCRHITSLAIKVNYNRFSMLFANNSDELKMPGDSIPVIFFLIYNKSTGWKGELNSIKPKVIIISERWGKLNWLQELVKSNEIKIYNLKNDGAVTILLRGGSTRFQSELSTEREGFYK